MGVSAPEFVESALGIAREVARTQMSQAKQAADLVVGSLAAGGVLNAFGTGHSEALAMELAGRAGGLVPTNRLTLRDPVLRGGEPPSLLEDPLLERNPATAHRVYELAPVQPPDIFVIASNSGANGCIVEFAKLVKDKGHPLIAVTSMSHTSGVPSRHASGRKLFEFADVVLDNGAPYGDAILALPDGGAVCGISSITNALLAQMVIAEVVATLLERGMTPPVYLSANIPGGDAHNDELEARYADRLQRII